MTYPNLIRLYRRTMGLRMKELAAMTGVRPHTIYMWECQRTLPRLSHILAVGAALDCPVEVLFYRYYALIRARVRKRMSTLGAKRYPDIRSCPTISAIEQSLQKTRKRKAMAVSPTRW